MRKGAFVPKLTVPLHEPVADTFLTRFHAGVGEGASRSCSARADLEKFARYVRKIFAWGFMSFISHSKGEPAGRWVVPLVDIVLDLLLRSFPVSSLSSPRWELLVCFSGFVGLDIVMRAKQSGWVVAREGTKREEKKISSRRGRSTRVRRGRVSNRTDLEVADDNLER